MSNIVNIEVIDSQNVPSTTSLKISEVFGKRHDDVIKAIENHVAEGDLTARNFAASSYKDSSGKSNKFYILDETFTTFLVMGFTGKEAVKWKLQYIKEFQRMREEIQNSKVIRETGDKYALADKLQKMVLDSKRKEIEGKDSHIGVHVQISRRTNELAFGYHEAGIRQNMDKPQSLSLNKAFEDTVKVILDGVTNPTKIKEAVETKWIEERITKKLSKPK